jgi:two-component system nitrate/nitrite response regulator NarL
VALRSRGREGVTDRSSAFDRSGGRLLSEESSVQPGSGIESVGAGASLARILVADPQPLTRLGIRRALEEHGFEVCAEVADAQTAVEVVQREQPDVCLIDLGTNRDAVSAIEKLTMDVPDSRVLALTASCDDFNLLDALCAGACGYVAKDAEPARLAAAITSALEGEVSLSRPLLEALVAAVRDHREKARRLESAAVPLTTREREVLELLQSGLRTADVAKRLFIAQVTVRSHICSIVKKLSVPDRKAAIRLVDDPERSAGER